VNPVANLAQLRQFLAPLVSLSFDDMAAEHAGTIRPQLAKEGRLIGPNDLLIASIALAHGLTVVTGNTGEFGRVAGLKTENWVF
jgi:tRNA(fMet)-specific endonuclease VapC